MATKITDRDKGLKALMKRLAPPKASVTVGVHAEEGAAPHGDGTTVLDVALFQEFGTADQEAQPYLRTWADENESAHEARMREIGEGVVKGSVPNVAAGLERFGLGAALGLKKHMAGMPGVEEGDPTPLDDSGRLIGSVTHKVKK